MRLASLNDWALFYETVQGYDPDEAERLAARRVHEQAERERLRLRAEREQRRSDTAAQTLLCRAREATRNGG